jgi:hypothetical protein
VDSRWDGDGGVADGGVADGGMADGNIADGGTADRGVGFIHRFYHQPARKPTCSKDVRLLGVRDPIGGTSRFDSDRRPAGNGTRGVPPW